MDNNGRKMESIKNDPNGNRTNIKYPFLNRISNRLAMIEQKSVSLNKGQQKLYEV